MSTIYDLTNNLEQFNNQMRSITRWNTLVHARKFHERYHEKHMKKIVETKQYVLDCELHEEEPLFDELLKQIRTFFGASYETEESKGNFVISGFDKSNHFIYGVKSEFSERQRTPSATKLLEGLCEVGVSQSETFGKPVYIIPPERFNRVSILAFNEDMDISTVAIGLPPGYTEIIESKDSLLRLIGSTYNRDEVKAYLSE